MWRRWTTALCAVLWLTACDPTMPAGPRFSDVMTPPPLAPATPAWLVRNDRPLAEWLAYVTELCARHGCAGGGK